MQPVYSRRAVVADVVVVGHVALGLAGTVGPTAAHLMCGKPHHLRVVPHVRQVVVLGAVPEDLLLHEPTLDGKIPAGQESVNLDVYLYEHGLCIVIFIKVIRNFYQTMSLWASLSHSL